MYSLISSILDLGFKEISYLKRGLNKIKKFSFLEKIESNMRIFKSKFKKSNLQNIQVNKDHFSNAYDTPGLPGNLLNKNMLIAHKVLSMASKKYKFQVFNCTLGGYLDIHPRIPLDYILKDS